MESINAPQRCPSIGINALQLSTLESATTFVRMHLRLSVMQTRKVHTTAISGDSHSATRNSYACNQRSISIEMNCKSHSSRHPPGYRRHLFPLDIQLLLSSPSIQRCILQVTNKLTDKQLLFVIHLYTSVNNIYLFGLLIVLSLYLL